MLKRIKILGKTYEIKRADFKDDLLFNGTLLGKIHFATNTIYIVRDLNEENEEEALLHEICHILDEQLLLALGEEGVTKLSVGLYAAMQDNNKLFKTGE